MQVGEEKKVLEIGKAALQHQDAKPFVHDLLLAIALTEVRISSSILTQGMCFTCIWDVFTDCLIFPYILF